MKGWLPPSVGFVLFVSALLGTSLLFAWGFTRPRLDHIWQTEIELKVGERDALSGAELGRFNRVLRDHPSYATHLTEGKTSAIISAHSSNVVDVGYAYLVRTRALPGETLKVTLLDKKKKVEIKAKSSGKSDEGTVTRDEAFTWTLPVEGPFPELVELRFSEKVPIELHFKAESEEPTHGPDPQEVDTTDTTGGGDDT